jgi:hypothetical protein
MWKHMDIVKNLNNFLTQYIFNGCYGNTGILLRTLSIFSVSIFNRCYRNTWILLWTLSIWSVSILKYHEKKNNQSKRYQLKSNIFSHRWLIKRNRRFMLQLNDISYEQKQKCLCWEKVYVLAIWSDLSQNKINLFYAKMVFKNIFIYHDDKTKRYVELQHVLLVTQ